MLDNVFYNRSERAYEVCLPGGDVARFPAGAEGRRRAQRAAVRALSPALYDYVTGFIARRGATFTARAWKAAELVLSDAVRPATAGGALATVAGGSEHGAYLVRGVDGALVCDCPDFDQLGAPYDETGQPWCKHLIATMAALETAVLD